MLEINKQDQDNTQSRKTSNMPLKTPSQNPFLKTSQNSSPQISPNVNKKVKFPVKKSSCSSSSSSSSNKSVQEVSDPSTDQKESPEKIVKQEEKPVSAMRSQIEKQLQQAEEKQAKEDAIQKQQQQLQQQQQQQQQQSQAQKEDNYQQKQQQFELKNQNQNEVNSQLQKQLQSQDLEIQITNQDVQQQQITNQSEQQLITSKYQIIDDIEKKYKICKPLVILAILIQFVFLLLLTLTSGGEYLRNKVLNAILVIYVPISVVFFILIATFRYKYQQSDKNSYFKKSKNVYMFWCAGTIGIIIGIVSIVIFSLEFYTTFMPYFTDLQDLKVEKYEFCLIQSIQSNKNEDWAEIEKYKQLSIQFSNNQVDFGNKNNNMNDSMGLGCQSNLFQESRFSGEGDKDLQVNYVVTGEKISKFGYILPDTYPLKFPSWHCEDYNKKIEENSVQKSCFVGKYTYKNEDSKTVEINQVLLSEPPMYYDQGIFYTFFAVFLCLGTFVFFPVGIIIFRFYRTLLKQLSLHFEPESDFEMTHQEWQAQKEKEAQEQYQSEQQQQQNANAFPVSNSEHKFSFELEK